MKVSLSSPRLFQPRSSVVTAGHLCFIWLCVLLIFMSSALQQLVKFIPFVRSLSSISACNSKQFPWSLSSLFNPLALPINSYQACLFFLLFHLMLTGIKTRRSADPFSKSMSPIFPSPLPACLPLFHWFLHPCLLLFASGHCSFNFTSSCQNVCPA